MWSNVQDTNSDGESILLLQPIDNRSNKHKSKQSSPSSSYIGGVPRYHENDTLVPASIGIGSTTTNPQCSKCNKSMYLLLQLHAPVDDYDRSLYVFGCNNSACHSYKNESDETNTIKRFHPCIGIDGPLRCFRSQTSWATPASTDTTDTSSKAVSSSKVKKVDLVDNDWGIGDDDNANGGWGDNGDDDWGGGNSDKDVSMNDLEDMLTKCEMQSTSKKIEREQQQQAAKASQPSSKDSSKSTDKVNNAPSFDHHNLEMFNEPHIGNASDSDDEEDVVDSSDVDQMLSRYLDMEEDEEILSVLKGGDTNNSSSNNNNDKGGGGGERYERLPPDERALLAFTNRLNCAPNQVARYAYGGTPLWSIPLPPKLQQQKPNNKQKKKANKPQKAPFPDIPNCSCGAKRLFEFQILPSLLHVLNVDSHAIHGSKDSMDVDDLLSKGGMDWGCIAVYSCSESCEQSREEFIIVQKAIGDEPVKKAKLPTTAIVDNDKDMDE